jgi:HEAT repeat protein
MKLTQTIGLGIALCSVSLVLAGGGITPKKEDVPKYLNQLQTSSVPSERARAAEMIGRRGSINLEDVESAIEPLKKTLQGDSDVKVKIAAAKALGAIRPNDTVPFLIERLNSETMMPVKLATVETLAQYGPDAKEALEPLREFGKKFDSKKSKEGQLIMAAIQAINGTKKKKN